MNCIQFENVRNKEKACQDLREVREQMLNEAKQRTEKKADRDAKKLFEGKTNWMLPSVKDKSKKKIKKAKKSKKSILKKHSKKTHKKHKHSDIASESSGDVSITDDSDCSVSDNLERLKRERKSKKHNKKSKKRRQTSSSSNQTSDDEKNNTHLEKSEEPLKRDSWMTDVLMLKTYSKEREDKKQKERQIESYDPVKSSRELNPYWKVTGTGLPAFQKPRDNDDNKCRKSETLVFSQRSIGTKGWQKQGEKFQINRNTTSVQSDRESDNVSVENTIASTTEFLTDQQMNELGAKILKAEIMGNMGLANELREKLEKARTQRNIFKERKKSEYVDSKRNYSYESKEDKFNQEERILLTQTDRLGNSRPLPAPNPRKMCGEKKQKHVNSHDDSGKRIRYFADDDRYDIKQMFEIEKYKSASEVNLQFANIAGKHKNPGDDLEDIFAEEIYKVDSVRLDQKNRNRAIHEHKKMEAALDNCDKCFDSTKMKKELLVCVGENAYLALPWYQGLQPGHCMIIPTQHVTCCTQVDEDTWMEITEFRKSLTRMFAAQKRDLIFCEIANKLHKRPHLVIHCFPIEESDGQMAPFYFKKAIEESEYEWCINKQLISLRSKSLRNAIPKGLPYFWVNFGMDSGYAHIIEDEERFPANFAQEIIGGMLNLDPSKWRRPQKEQHIITKVKLFADNWKIYDFKT